MRRPWIELHCTEMRHRMMPSMENWMIDELTSVKNLICGDDREAFLSIITEAATHRFARCIPIVVPQIGLAKFDRNLGLNVAQMAKQLGFAWHLNHDESKLTSTWDEYKLTATLADIAIRSHINHNWSLPPIAYTRTTHYSLDDILTYAYSTFHTYAASNWITTHAWLSDIITYMTHTYHGIPLALGHTGPHIDTYMVGDDWCDMEDITTMPALSQTKTAPTTTHTDTPTDDTSCTDADATNTSTTAEHPTDEPTLEICSYIACKREIQTNDGHRFRCCDHVLHERCCVVGIPGIRHGCIVCYHDTDAVCEMFAGIFEDDMSRRTGLLHALQEMDRMRRFTDKVAWTLLYGDDVRRQSTHIHTCMRIYIC